MNVTGGELTVGRWIRDRAALSPGAVAVVSEGRRITYGQLDSRSEELATGLLAAGLNPGDRVATLTASSIEHVALLFACAKAGLTLVPLNWRLAAAEVAFQLGHCRPRLVAVEPGRDTLAGAAVAIAGCSPRRVPLTEDGLDELAEAGRAKSPGVGVDVMDDHPLFVFYTSGTTGRPKGAVLTHANCFWTNLSLDRALEVRRSDSILAVLPQYHVGGWNVQPLLGWWKGATVVIEPSFDPRACLERIAGERVSVMMGVPATYLFLARERGFASADLRSLRLAVVGGAPMPEALLRTWRDRGVAIVQGYGLTEAAPNVLGLPPEEADRRLGWAGKPYPHVDVDLVDPRTGERLVGPGEGELVVRGPNVFPGYLDDPAGTAAALRDGWLHTGDVAERDGEGYYRIRDRLKDMYISGGENVYPAEVEGVLHDHPGVAEAAVIGTHDERWGEVGLALVVPSEGAGLSEDELVAHCRQRLAAFKVPRRVRFLDALPRNAVGKVDKRLLARQQPERGEP